MVPEPAELLVCLAKTPPSSSRPLCRCCPVFPVSPPASSVPCPSVLPWLWLARCTCPPAAAPQGTCWVLGDPRHAGQELCFHPLVLPIQGLARAGVSPAAPQGCPSELGHEQPGTALRDGHQGCLQPPASSQRWHHMWEDLRGLARSRCCLATPNAMLLSLAGGCWCCLSAHMRVLGHPAAMLERLVWHTALCATQPCSLASPCSPVPVSAAAGG